jgi:2-polyprenyl-3-methyl-5-hydroxy-6-metoxy-1,4-benzoquinol methylase
LYFHPSTGTTASHSWGTFDQRAAWRQRKPSFLCLTTATTLPISWQDSQLPNVTGKRGLAGFQNGQAYDQNRPSYLPEVVDKLLRALHISGVAGAEVLDLAAGTGKFTELLAKQGEQFQITAVEPHDDMRNELEKKHLSNVNVLNGLATKIPLADEGVDAVVVAQVRFQIIITMLFLHCGLLASFPRSLFFQCKCLGRKITSATPKGPALRT